MPTILLHGDEDGATLPGMSENKDRFFTGGYTRHVLSGVGHFVQREDADRVTQAVGEFLKP